MQFLVILMMLLLSQPAQTAPLPDQTVSQPAQTALLPDQPVLLPPADFLGYDLGDRFTRHHDIIAYAEHLAANSPYIEWRTYGKSYGHRPLFAMFVSSEKNLRALDTIRVNNRRMAGLDAGQVEGRTAAILWMSYGIHGNEASSPEAAMQTLYELASGMESDGGIRQWLENVVVVIDPVLNPDGRERYVNWFGQTQGRWPDPRLETREHNEPWPGARSNHYYFDLNRDWAWLTQIESQHRAAFYQSWMPHVHADFHEMFTNDYYFPPAAEPFHAAITNWQREFQNIIGRNHASRFDSRHERYFTAEIFDLFYPGYGDTWPTFNGAIGMTYEQMGHSRAGTIMIDGHGDTLTLADRIRNQHDAGMSTVEVTAQNSERLLREFADYFLQAQQKPAGRYSSFVISGGDHPDRINALLDFLDRQEIRYELAEEGRRFSGTHYATGQEQRRRTGKGDIVVPVMQPKGVLAHVLFDPDPSAVLADSNTYDITAWALPYAFGLDAWAVTDPVRSTGVKPARPGQGNIQPAHAYQGSNQPNSPTQSNIQPGHQYQSHNQPDRPKHGRNLKNAGDDASARVDGTKESPRENDAYAWLMAWGDVRDAAFLAGLLQDNVRVSITERSFTHAGRSWPPGSLVITRRANRHLGDRLPQIIDNIASRYHRDVQSVTTGLTEQGIDLGSPYVHPLEKPVVAVPSGNGIQSGSLGEIRHFFDYTLGYPLAVFHASGISAFPLEKYNVLLLPEGGYSDWSESDWDRLMDWVNKGGRLIALSSAIQKLADRDEPGISLRSLDSGAGREGASDSSDAPDTAGSKQAQETETAGDSRYSPRFENRRRDGLAHQVTGAVFQVQMDDSHPLAFGIGPHYATLKRGTLFPDPLQNGWNVGRIADDAFLLGGWAGGKAQELAPGALVAGTISVGEGQIVLIADNPLFRGFWRNGQLLLSNAIFQAWIAK